MAAIDLNADLGEGMSEDAELTAQVTSANVACGFHAGDVETMAVTVRRAREHRVAVGAHPSYRDRENFGRSPMNPSPDALQADLEAQLSALAEVAVGAMVEVRYLKPHGALYNRIAIDPEQAEEVARVPPIGSECASCARPSPTAAICRTAGSPRAANRAPC